MAASWALNLYSQSDPGFIAGKVIDWNTGQAVPNVDLVAGELNYAKVARTDANGSFTFVPRELPQAYFIYASSPRYGRLLQATFG